MDIEKRPNIRRMQMPETKKAEILPFDPRRDITSEDWQGMRDMLGAFKREGGWLIFANLAARVKNIDPNQAMYVSDADWEKILEEYAATKKDGLNWTLDVELMATLQTLRPNSAEVLQQQNTWKDHLEMLIQEVNAGSTVNGWGWHTVAFCAAELRIAYPDMARISDSDWNQMLNELAETRLNHEYAFSYQMASDMRILRDDSALSPGKEECEAAVGYLEEHRKDKSYTSFSHVALRLTLLAAEKVAVTEDGLEITLPGTPLEKDSSSRSMPTALEL